MKILFIVRGFPSDKDPMSGNYEAVQAKAIAAKGHEVSVIAIRWWNLRHFYKSRKIICHKVDSINVYECNGITAAIPYIHLDRIEYLVREKQFRRVFAKYVTDIGRPDVVHAHIVTMAYPALFLKTELHIPFIITEHWTAVNKEIINKRIIPQAKSYHVVDQVICVSEALANNLKQKFNVSSIVINNMVSDNFFRGRKIILHDGITKFIGVGGLRKNKRFDILVEAFALCKFPKNVCLDIVGEGEERQLIESKIHQHQLDEQIRLLGVKSPEEVNSLMCQSDCFVLSSRLETFAIVVIEAMAKGLPVIATRSGGPETFVRPEDGILVSKENVEELAAALKYMKNHYQEYDSEEIRQHCWDNFSQDVIANKIIDVYKQVMKRNANEVH